MAALHNILTVVRGVVCNSPSQSALGPFFFPTGKYDSQRALKMGVKVPEIKYSFWCERDIRGTNGTKREKYGEKYSGVNAASRDLRLSRRIPRNIIKAIFNHFLVKD